jgi:hypothetical protein
VIGQAGELQTSASIPGAVDLRHEHRADRPAQLPRMHSLPNSDLGDIGAMFIDEALMNRPRGAPAPASAAAPTPDAPPDDAHP